MSSNVATINNIARQLFIYGGSFLAFVGIIGACANIYLFTRPRYRRVPCCLFMLTSAIFDLTVLCIALLSYRIINQILQYDIMTFNLYVCKLRLYLVSVSLPLPIWFVFLSTFNRFCITSRNAVLRQWCTFRRSRWLVAGLVLTFATYRAPDLSYVTIMLSSGRLTCLISPSAVTYVSLHTYFTFPVVLTTAPLCLLVTMGFLIRSNLRQLAVQRTANRMEHQVTSMILLQALGTACLIPYTINVFYSTITKFAVKSEYQVAIENLITQLVTLGFYTYYSSGFYIYVIASPDVQRNIQSNWHSLRRKLRMHNQISPTTAQTVPEPHAIVNS